MNSFDVAVIGGGIVGVTSAFFLTRLGKKVVVLEKGDLAKLTTDNSFAWINASSKAAKDDYHHLNARGLTGYNQLAQQFGEEPLGLNPCGQLSLVPTEDEVRYKELRKRWELLKDKNYPVAWVHAKDLPNLEPSIKFEQEYEALFNFGELCLDAPRFTRFLADRLVDQGGTIIENTEVLSLNIDESGEIHGLNTTEDTLATGQILLATGPDSAEMLAQLTGFSGFANRFPLNKSPGLLLTTPALTPRQLTRRVIYWEQSPDLHILPHFSGGWRMGADDMDGLIADNNSEETQLAAGECLLQRARERLVDFPENLSVQDCRIGIGVRPVPEDGVSIADLLPGTDNFFITVTHSGVTLAPALGQLMAEFIATGTRPEPLFPFSLKRFPGFN